MEYFTYNGYADNEALAEFCGPNNSVVHSKGISVMCNGEFVRVKERGDVVNKDVDGTLSITYVTPES